ncbi:alginate export family protein [Candidatus Poribacteria bacterium]|nr:alginate export family protein [Candidatus Poribacteria bacterium]
MKRLLVWVTIAAALSLFLSFPALAQIKFQSDETEIHLSGFLRMRATGEMNFDLNDADDSDKAVDFFDARSYLTLEVIRKPFNLVFSLDLAGNEFNDGTVLGNENPTVLREFNPDLRHLYLQYNGFLTFSLGRQPAQAGHGIVSHIIRDSFRTSKKVGSVTFVFNVIKGGENITEIPGGAKPRALNHPTGADDDLDAFHFVTAFRPKENFGGKIEILWQRDTSPNDRFPEKLFIDINADGKIGHHFDYAAELALLRGQTPDLGRGRLDNEAFLIYADGTYHFRRFSGGLSFGLGSGDDEKNDDKQKNFQNLFMDETGFHYTNLFSDDIHGYDGTPASLGRGSGFANVTFLQPHVSVQLMDDLWLKASYTRLIATQDQIKGTGPLGNLTATSTAETRDIGDEIDLNLDYKIDANANWFLKLGAFFPGEIYGSGTDNAFKAEAGIGYRL